MNESGLNGKAREALVQLAKGAIEAAVLHRDDLKQQLAETLATYPELQEAAGAFVTIYVDGRLRGCLGQVEPHESLAEVVTHCARRAPHCDRRFRPVLPRELAALSFKISILSPPEPLVSLNRIELGQHGLLVRHDGQIGLLLPEVAVEQGWDVPTFIRQLRLKAGIPAAVAPGEIQLWTFTSQVLQSEDFPSAGPSPKRT